MKLARSINIALAALVVCAGLASAATQNPDPAAKGLFYEQLNKKDQKLNNGLRYWIELDRGNKSYHVSNKHQFVSGDRIRFHVVANINGYAYILLKNGSRGEKCVLFPDAKSNDDNNIQGGREYVLPGDGFLTFDENPGTEKLTLLLSRAQIDAVAYLNDPKNEPMLIAANLDGSKDLIPTKHLISFGAPSVASNTEPATPKVEKTDTTKTATAATKPAVKPQPKKQKPEAPKVATTKPTTASSKPQMIASNPTTGKVNSGSDENVVTAITTDPTKELYIDVMLQHNK